MSSNSKGMKLINGRGKEVQDSKFDIPTTTISGLQCIFTYRIKVNKIILQQIC